jgi:hypothetical protein
MFGHIDHLEFFVGDFDAFLIDVRIDFGFYCKNLFTIF